MEYIRVPAVYEKMKRAEETYAPMVLMAPSGCGKSAAISYYYRRKKTLILSCKSGKPEDMPAPSSIRQSVVVIEDAQWLNDEEGIRYIKELLNFPGIQTVILTRGDFPSYLAPLELSLGFVRITEKDFLMGPKEVRSFFASMGTEISDDDLEKVWETSGGYAPSVYYFANRMEHGEHFSESLRTLVREDLFHLWDTSLFHTWDTAFIDFALAVCPYDTFSIPLAEYLTGNTRIAEVIEYCRTVMAQLQYEEDGTYSFRLSLKRFYLWKRNLSWSREKSVENYVLAAKYYEENGDIKNALRFYDEAGDTASIKRLLIYNAKLNPGNGHYIETKDYYFNLPREEILDNPILISGICMLCALVVEPAKSDEWYDELVKYEKNRNNPKEKRKEAKSLIAYLDIALPQRGIRGIISILKGAFSLVRKGDLSLPEMSVTSNMPSVMNGGLDFCDWSKNDKQLAKMMGGPVEGVVGKHGKGLVTLALAESGLEKGTMSSLEVLNRCNEGYEKAGHGGSLEMCFVATGILTRQHILDGNISAALRVFNGFKAKAEAEKARNLRGNMEAFEAWISLYSGDVSTVRKYINSVPDIREGFSTLDKFRQLIKARCLVEENRLDEALDILSILRTYYIPYQRHFIQMECETLTSIILYRKGDSAWREQLADVFIKGFEYHFTRLFSLEGSAILPLLKEFNTDAAGIEMRKYIKSIENEATFVSGYYPDYMLFIPEPTINLTKRESQILSMLCMGMSTDEICDECGISYDGLKKHNKNIYRKLGARDRAEAERKAIHLGLVQRPKI